MSVVELYDKFKKSVFVFLESDEYKNRMIVKQKILTDYKSKNNEKEQQQIFIKFKLIVERDLEEIKLFCSKLNQLKRILISQQKNIGIDIYNSIINEIDFILDYQFNYGVLFFKKKYSIESLVDLKYSWLEEYGIEKYLELDCKFNKQIKLIMDKLNKDYENNNRNEGLKSIIAITLLILSLSGCINSRMIKIEEYRKSITNSIIESDFEISSQKKFGVDFLTPNLDSTGGRWLFCIDYIFNSYYRDYNIFRNYNLNYVLFISKEEKKLYISKKGKDKVRIYGSVVHLVSGNKGMILSPIEISKNKDISRYHKTLIHEIAHLHHFSLPEDKLIKFELAWKNLGIGGFESYHPDKENYLEDVACLVQILGYFLYSKKNIQDINSIFTYLKTDHDSEFKILSKIKLLVKYGFFPEHIKEKIIKFISKY